VDAVRVLISRNADVSKPEPCDGLTALHEAAQGVHVPVMQLLISKGARIDVRSKHGQTPLHQAAFYGQLEASGCLLDHGADINVADDLGFTPLMYAASEKRLPLVDLLRAEPNLVSNQLAGPSAGQTALHITSFKGSSFGGWSQYGSGGQARIVSSSLGSSRGSS
jgi:ankyrin repeat protein